MSRKQYQRCDPSIEKPIRDALEAQGSTNVQVWSKPTGDGELRFIIAEEMGGWHLSVTHAKRSKGGLFTAGRYPTWLELVEARQAALETETEFAVLMPGPAELEEVPDATLHLYEFPPRGVMRDQEGRTPAGLILL